MAITLTPPATGDFSITLNTPNGSNATYSLKLAGAADASLLRGYLKSLPGGDFTVTVKATGSINPDNNGLGIIFRDTAGKYSLGGILHASAGLILVQRWSDHTTYNSDFATNNIGDSEWPTWFRAQFTASSSDIQYSYSYTGDNWVNIGGSETYLGTADAFGICSQHSNGTTPPVVWYEHFAVS